MKKIFITLGIVSLILLIVSCTKTEIEDSYYVQYTVSTMSSGPAGYSLFTVKDVGSNLRQSDFPATHGPVKKGYVANKLYLTSENVFICLNFGICFGLIEF